MGAEEIRMKQKFDVVSPVDGTTIMTLDEATPGKIARTLDHAHAATQRWRDFLVNCHTIQVWKQIVVQRWHRFTLSFAGPDTRHWALSRRWGEDLWWTAS